MYYKVIAEIDASGLCFHVFAYQGQDLPVLAANHVDVTTRTEGPFLGKVYDRKTDTWSALPDE